MYQNIFQDIQTSDNTCLIYFDDTYEFFDLTIVYFRHLIKETYKDTTYVAALAHGTISNDNITIINNYLDEHLMEML